MESEQLVNDNFDDLAKDLMLQTVEIMAKEKLNLDSKSDIVPILRIVMEAIEEKELSGPKQKDLGKMVLQSVIRDSNMSDENKETCLEIIESGIIENTMELISDASKGKLNINKKQAKKALLSWLFECLQSFNKSKTEEKNDNKI
jgi:predicted GNAT family N-acyltransferase